MKIAVYTICKNEEQHVERWLETTKDADLCVVADTGSTDLTMHRFNSRILSKGTPVHSTSISIEPFRFDDARNTALSLVPSDVDVCVSLDMDEVLSPGWRQVIEENDGVATPGNNGIVTFDYQTRTFLQNSRVHSRYGWRWRYPYHEGLYPNMVEQTFAYDLSDITITHDPIGEKTRRNIALYNLAWGEFENPGDARMMFYYGREMLWSGYNKEGLQKLVEFCELHPNAIEIPEAKQLLLEHSGLPSR